MSTTSRQGAAYGLAAAALFGLSTPLAKVLLPAAEPLVLAALLYLGGGGALLLFSAIRPPSAERDTRLQRTDVLPLLAVVLLGGVAGPVLMLVGLERLSAATGSLLLNLEAPFTIALALLVFREHLGRRELFAALFIVGGAAVLTVRPGELHADPWGVLALAGACLSWAVDNNLSQRLSLRDPVRVVRAKSLGAGACSLAVALAFGFPLPEGRTVFAALLVGAFSYGLSLVFDMYALRLLGAAREAAIFATAPFVGALAAVPIAGDRLGRVELAAGALMIAGLALLLRERHGHRHAHEALEHEHLHVHDAHHQHAHEGPVTEPHSHPHRHAPLVHDHPHVSDLHHRHRHEPYD